MTRLAIVIPCYNERDNIPLIVARLRACLAGRGDVVAILVDNGSTDGSDAVMARELAGQGQIRSLRVAVNRGYGHGILTGLAAAEADVLAWTHADMQTDPADVLRALAAFDRTGGVVKGRRQNRALMETLFTAGMQVVASALLGVRVSDVNAQPKLFSRAFYEAHLRAGAPLDFSLDLYLLWCARQAGVPIGEIPVVFAPRAHGEAKGGGSWRTRLRLIRRTFAYIWALRRAVRR